MSTLKAVTFDCGHTEYLPYDPPQDASPSVAKYWRDQSVPLVPGSVAACPGCITTRSPKGSLQTVYSVEDDL
mgnify:CR=1 FL=1